MSHVMSNILWRVPQDHPMGWPIVVSRMSYIMGCPTGWSQSTLSGVCHGKFHGMVRKISHGMSHKMTHDMAKHYGMSHWMSHGLALGQIHYGTCHGTIRCILFIPWDIRWNDETSHGIIKTMGHPFRRPTGHPIGLLEAVGHPMDDPI